MSPEEYDRQYLNVVLHDNLPWEVLVRVDCHVDGEYRAVSLLHTHKMDILAGTSKHCWGILRETRAYQEMTGEREFEETSEERALDIFQNMADMFVTDRMAFTKNSLARMAGQAMNSCTGKV